MSNRLHTKFFLSDIKVRTKEKIHNWADHMLFLHSDDIFRSLEHSVYKKMANYFINQPFCSHDFIRCYKIIRS